MFMSMIRITITTLSFEKMLYLVLARDGDNS
jgi:hypothetical protein